MIDDGYSLYRWWLCHGRKADREYDKQFVKDNITSTLQESPAYQDDALRNGQSQPLIATREKTNKCKITVLPGDEMNIGDLIYVFGEYWLCMEIYMDEYGIKYGEIWMCNEVFHYQDHDLNVIDKYAIIDDGSYSKNGDKAIPVTGNYYTCYISMDEESAALYVDKRLAIDVVFDSKGNEILDVGKIAWLDTRSRNFGEGSHLLMFGLSDDVFNVERDNLDLRICDYRVKAEDEEQEPETPDPPEDTAGELTIAGKATIRIGTGRTYKVSTILDDGNSGDAPDSVVWSTSGMASVILVESRGDECIVSVPLDDGLIGESVTLICTDTSGKYREASKNVGVISIG